MVTRKGASCGSADSLIRQSPQIPHPDSLCSVLFFVCSLFLSLSLVAFLSSVLFLSRSRSFESPSLSPRRRQAADRVECSHHPCTHVCVSKCVHMCAWELASRQSTGRHVVVCVPLSPVPRRARAGLFARACVTPSIRTGIRGAFFHFFIAAERARDGDCDVVSSRLQARAVRVRRARAGETEERARLHALPLPRLSTPRNDPRGSYRSRFRFVEEIVEENWEPVWPPSVSLSQQKSAFFVCIASSIFTLDTIIMLNNYLDNVMSQF